MAFGLVRGQVPGVEIKGPADGRQLARASWKHMHRCGDAWTCPRCSPPITEARRSDVVAALANWRAIDHADPRACRERHVRGLPCSCPPGRGVALVTLTHPHGLYDALARRPSPGAPADPVAAEAYEAQLEHEAAELRARRARADRKRDTAAGNAKKGTKRSAAEARRQLAEATSDDLTPAEADWLREHHLRLGLVERQAQVLRYMAQSRDLKDLKTRWGIAHSIRGAEVMHGDENGWHPHQHVIWLTERCLTAAEGEAMRRQLYEIWRAACERYDLGTPSPEHGVDVGLGGRPDEYIAKWGAAEELTLARVKLGKTGSRSPWGLLVDAQGGDAVAGARWVEFARAYKGRSQLHWSPGARAACGLKPEKTEEEILAEDRVAEDERLAAEERVTHFVPLGPLELDALLVLGMRERLLDVLEGLARGDAGQLEREDVELVGKVMAQTARRLVSEYKDGELVAARSERDDLSRGSWETQRPLLLAEVMRAAELALIDAAVARVERAEAAARKAALKASEAKTKGPTT